MHVSKQLIDGSILVAVALLVATTTRVAEADPGSIVVMDVLSMLEAEAGPDTSVEADSCNMDVRADAIVAAEFGITEFYLARLGIDWNLESDFSLGVQLDVGGVGRSGYSSTWLVGIAPIMRWEFLQRDSWSMYADLGVGVAWTGEPVPAAGTSFNFTPQAGIGANFDLSGSLTGRVGLGWYHMSNARTGSNNPGLDAVSFNVGIEWRF